MPNSSTLRTREIVHPVFGIRKSVIEPECFLPAAPPGGWQKIDAVCDGGSYIHINHQGQMLAVIISGCIEDDGIPWVHLSISKRASRKSMKRILPTWDELKFAKSSFVGPSLDCIQVLPRENEYVNIGEVLHLFYRLDGERPCPDFTSGSGSI